MTNSKNLQKTKIKLHFILATLRGIVTGGTQFQTSFTYTWKHFDYVRLVRIKFGLSLTHCYGIDCVQKHCGTK